MAGVQHHGAGARQRVGAAKAGVDEHVSGGVGDWPQSRHGGAAMAGVRHHGAGARQCVGAAMKGVDDHGAEIKQGRPRSRHEIEPR